MCKGVSRVDVIPYICTSTKIDTTQELIASICTPTKQKQRQRQHRRRIRTCRPARAPSSCPARPQSPPSTPVAAPNSPPPIHHPCCRPWQARPPRVSWIWPWTGSRRCRCRRPPRPLLVGWFVVFVSAGVKGWKGGSWLHASMYKRGDAPSPSPPAEAKRSGERSLRAVGGPGESSSSKGCGVASGSCFGGWWRGGVDRSVHAHTYIHTYTQLDLLLPPPPPP